MAELYAGQNNYEQELEIREEIESLAPDDIDNQIRIIELLIQTGALDEAKEKTEALLPGTDNADLQQIYDEMTVDAPAFNLTSGSYDDYQLLQLTGDYTTETVYYTTDGSEPTTGSKKFTDDLVISNPETTIRAKAYSILGYASEETELDLTITKEIEEVTYVSETEDEYSYDMALGTLAYAYFDKNYDDPIYNYELAQIREVWLLGYSFYTEDPSAVFYSDSYAIGNSTYSDYGEYTLNFAQYTPFLKTLTVCYQESLDLTPLASLQYLEDLSLLNNRITDISALGGLTSLKKLSLGWNDISDVSALAGLTGLESLGLWNNQIADVSSLGGLTNLTYFDISHNQVSDIGCVSSMTNLAELWINDNQITSLAPLDACSNLTILMQTDNPIADYGSLQSISKQLFRTDVTFE